MSNYHIGRRLEYKVIKILREALPEDRYTIVRSASSKTAVDVTVLEHRTRRFCGIQCKSRLKRKKNA